MEGYEACVVLQTWKFDSWKSQKSVAELSCTARKERPIGGGWECENGCLATLAILEIYLGGQVE